MTTTTPHNIERDRIATEWRYLPPAQCESCKIEILFPQDKNILVRTEFVHAGRLRADVAVVFISEGTYGIVEVIYSSPPSHEALAVHEQLTFAYYRYLSHDSPSSRPTAWLCSPECWRWFLQHGGSVSSSWQPPQCDGCQGYLHENRLTSLPFNSWVYDSYTTLCIHCAAGWPADAQWRAPGDIAFGDPREWTPDGDSDAVIYFLAYFDAAFWAMVWRDRETKLNEPETYVGNKNPAAEDATERRLTIVEAALSVGDYRIASNLLFPIGAPPYADYPDEPERLLAFRPENCCRTAVAWERLRQHRLSQLPEELQTIIRNPPSTD